MWLGLIRIWEGHLPAFGRSRRYSGVRLDQVRAGCIFDLASRGWIAKSRSGSANFGLTRNTFGSTPTKTQPALTRLGLRSTALRKALGTTALPRAGERPCVWAPPLPGLPERRPRRLASMHPVLVHTRSLPLGGWQMVRWSSGGNMGQCPPWLKLRAARLGPKLTRIGQVLGQPCPIACHQIRTRFGQLGQLLGQSLAKGVRRYQNCVAFRHSSRQA